MSNWSQCGKFEKFYFREVTLLETIELIGRLSNSTSFGTDQIDALALKVAVSHLASPIRHLINVSLKTGKYANKWKLAKLIPLLKSSELNQLLPSSYRPISILPTISKVVEKAAQIQLLEYMEKYKMLNESTHAYRNGRSTTTTLIELTEQLYTAIDANKIASIMTLDQSAAFDCVIHKVLLDKLEMYNISGDVLKWICSYLMYRTQFVEIGTSQSKMYAMERGVPQGSVLGPLLYSLYTNEMSVAIKNPNCKDKVHLNKDELFEKKL